MVESNKGILLESGTNELEIIEFEVNQNKYGINVIKVKEIIMPAHVTIIPNAHPFVEGIIQLRGEVLPVVNMRKVLKSQEQTYCANEKFIVTEFNQQKIVFHVDNVSKIHRISWERIEKPSDLYSSQSNEIVGVIKQDQDMILMLDFEKIITEINPNINIKVAEVKKLGKRERSNKRIVLAEDSALLRGLLEETLNEAGYEQVQFFENGREAFAYLDSLLKEGKRITEEVQLVITDIEMPQMDGHHLTKKIKETNDMNDLPVIIFSSLITDTLRHKGEIVGADAQVSKPEINELIKYIDALIL
ncbi:chemotaxis protein [Heyndrickxia ginsengihumi]|uniref:chemotaxis protein n=1 Tax=Heyndrickxia ginsengihumi TaxID=363870 RepID=UPI00255A3649|nr:chemotaxis protein [Heyndrickxia ginsengihumi]